MSLINDALKRAKQSQKKNPSGGPALMPVEQEPPGAVAWILPVAVIILIVAACFIFGLAMARHTVTDIVNAPDTNATQEITVVPTPGIPRPAPITNAEPVAAPELPKLQGIFYDPTRPWAILDGQTVYPGDRIGEFHVKEITKFTVTVVGKDGKPQTISLGN